MIPVEGHPNLYRDENTDYSYQTFGITNTSQIEIV